MESHSPNPTERFAIKIEELRPAPGAGPLAVLVWDLLTCLLRLVASLAERGPQQQACRADAGLEPGRRGSAGCSGSSCCQRCGCRGGRHAGDRRRETTRLHRARRRRGRSVWTTAGRTTAAQTTAPGRDRAGRRCFGVRKLGFGGSIRENRFADVGRIASSSLRFSNNS